MHTMPHDDDQRRIAALEAELAAVRAEMQDFTYTVSHDLRAPLRHILSYVKLVEEDAGHLLPDEAHGFLSVISDSALHMGQLMDGLLEMSRLGAAPLHTATVPLQPLVQSVADALTAEHPQRSVAWQISPHLPAVLADEVLLRKALGCVLHNAVKFTARRDTAHIVVSVEGDGLRGGSCVVLRVQDDGAGFNPAMQARLFKPFQRLHTSKQFPGIGMGLAMTRKIAERLGGAVAIEGVVDGGCTVCLSLPAAPPA